MKKRRKKKKEENILVVPIPEFFYGVGFYGTDFQNL